jgi:hypothetical protein
MTEVDGRQRDAHAPVPAFGMPVAPPASGSAARELAVQHFTQPDDMTCGPTALRKVYHFYGLDLELPAVTDTLERNEDGGTLAVFLGTAALRQGFRSRLYTYDLRIFDPTWATLDSRRW